MKKDGKVIRMILTEGLMVLAVLFLLLTVAITYKQPTVHSHGVSGLPVQIPELEYLSEDSLLNAGDAAMLDKIPGIGEVMAGRIIETREQEGLFQFPEDVMTVKGIGEKRFEDIMTYIEQLEASATDLPNSQ